MVNKKPEISREGNVVLIDCFDEKAAKTCEKEIVKVLNNRMLRYMMSRNARK